MASIRQRSDNSWQLIAELGYNAKGRRIQRFKTITVDDPALLRAPRRLENYLNTELVKFQAKCEAGTYIKIQRMTFEEFIDHFKSKFVTVDLEDKTQDNYIFQIDRRISPYFGHMYMDQIKTMHINDYFEYLRTPEARFDGKKEPLGSATQVYNYRVLRSIFSKAVEWQVLKENPMSGVSKPKEDDVKEMEVYDEHEIKALFEALEDEPLHLRVQVILAVTTGLRRAELAGLEWGYIDLDKGILEVKNTIPKYKDGEPLIKGPKNKKSARKIAIPQSVVEELKPFRSEWRKQRLQIEDKWEGGKYEFLFCHVDGKPVDPNRLTKRWIEFHRKHGLKAIRLHDLRHTSASWAIFKKVHSAAIASRLGHSNTKMLEIYGHIFESVDRATATVYDDMIPSKKSKKKEA